jgi:hypothetical protein
MNMSIPRPTTSQTRSRGKSPRPTFIGLTLTVIRWSCTCGCSASWQIATPTQLRDETIHTDTTISRCHYAVGRDKPGLSGVMEFVGRLSLAGPSSARPCVNGRYRPAMPDAPHLRPATPDEIADALSFALRYQGRKRVIHADDPMAQIPPRPIDGHSDPSRDNKPLSHRKVEKILKIARVLTGPQPGPDRPGKVLLNKPSHRGSDHPEDFTCVPCFSPASSLSPQSPRPMHKRQAASPSPTVVAT